MDDNVTNVFGAKFLSSLVPFDLCVDADGEDDGDKNEDDAEGESAEDISKIAKSAKKTPAAGAKESKRKIWGMVSKAGVGVGRADNDRQFLYLNGRPVDVPKVITGERLYRR